MNVWPRRPRRRRRAACSGCCCSRATRRAPDSAATHRAGQARSGAAEPPPPPAARGAARKGGADEVRAAVARMLERAAAAARAARRRPRSRRAAAGRRRRRRGARRAVRRLTRGVFAEQDGRARSAARRRGVDFQSPWGVHQLIDVLASPAGATRNARAGEVGRAHVDAARGARARLRRRHDQAIGAPRAHCVRVRLPAHAVCVPGSFRGAGAGGVKRLGDEKSLRRRLGADVAPADAAARGHGHGRHRPHYPISVITAAEALLAPDLELHAEVLALAAAQERRHGAAFDRALARFTSDQFRAKSCAARTRELVAAGAAHFDPAHPGRVDNTRCVVHVESASGGAALGGR